MKPHPDPEIGWWRGVKEWCLGENAGERSFGTCAFAAIGNLHDLVTTVNGNAEVMTDGEIEAMDHAVTGFSPTDRRTDRGAQLIDVLRYWSAEGWVGDPTLKPLGYWTLTNERIREGIETYGAVYCWCMLPKRDDDWDFSDGALRLGIPGTGAHAILIVGAGPGVYHLVTWGEIRTVTEAWWRTYGQENFAVLHPAWKAPPF